MDGRQASSSASEVMAVVVDFTSGQWSVENGEFFAPFPVMQSVCLSRRTQ